MTVGGEAGAPRNGARNRRGGRDGEEAAPERSSVERGDRANRERRRRGPEDISERRPRPPREDGDSMTDAETTESAPREAREPREPREPRRERSDGETPRAESRTRDVGEDRTPADLEQSKRRPRRDRASVARNQDSGERRPELIAALTEEATPNEALSAPIVSEHAETVATLETIAERTAFDHVEVNEPAPSDDAPRVKTAPAVVVVSPIDAAAEAVKQEPERPAGRAANDPREVRKREREARLRQEGVISDRSPE